MKTELKKYIFKLSVDLEVYREEADYIGKKMFDDLKVHASDALVKGIIGGVTGSGLSGMLAPYVSNFVLMLVGALIGSSKAIPRSIKTVLDSRRAREEHKNSSIAYIAEFR